MRDARRVQWASAWRIGFALSVLALAGCGGASGSSPQGASSSASTATSTAASAPPNQVKAGSGAADIAWTPPTTAADGSTLLNLAGYDIYYGTNPSALTQQIQVSNIGITNYMVTGLAAGTWYFVVTSYTSDGTQSAPSNVVTATVP